MQILHSRFSTLHALASSPPLSAPPLLSFPSFLISKSVRCCCSAIGDAVAAHPGIAKVILKKEKAQLFRDGNPMVYSGAVDRIVGRPPPKTGDIVVVTNGLQQPIAWGIYNSVSMFCVRLMQMEEEAIRDPSCTLNMEKLIQLRINAAANMRKRLELPRSDTNAYRLVNSEGDRLSGLIVDVFNDHAVIASSAAWVERYRSVIEIFIKEIPEIDYVKWRPSVEMLKEEGLIIDLKDFEPKHVKSKVKVMENGVNYIISLDGQKTGFYADQRDNRLLVGSLSKGRTVLDVCCYSGGFALNAAFGGAVHVTGIDSSLPALELAEENAKLNNISSSRISFLKEDATRFMKAAISEEKSWDLVILDPPKLAPSRKKAASSVGKKITVLRQVGAAADHPIDPSYPEGAYLTNFLLRIL